MGNGSVWCVLGLILHLFSLEVCVYLKRKTVLVDKMEKCSMWEQLTIVSSAVKKYVLWTAMII